MGKSSWRVVSISAWCTAAAGTALMLVSTFLPDRLVVPAAVAGLVLVAASAAVFLVRLLWD